MSLQTQRNSYSSEVVLSLFQKELSQCCDKHGYDPTQWEILIHVISTLREVCQKLANKEKEFQVDQKESGSVLFFIDEAQSLDHPGWLQPLSNECSKECSLFYILLKSIQELLQQIPKGFDEYFILTGSRLSMTEQVFKKHSPAQGVSIIQDVYTPFSLQTVEVFLQSYLRDDKFEEVKQWVDLYRMCGRPLYSASLLAILFQKIRDQAKANSGNFELSTVIQDCVHTHNQDVISRVGNAWNREDKLPKSSESPHSLLLYLFFMRVMGYTQATLKEKTSSSVKLLFDEAIFMASHNKKGEMVVNVVEEPETQAALEAVGSEASFKQENVEDDEVMRYIQDTASGSSSLGGTSKGEAAENGVCWRLYRDWYRAFEKNDDSEVPVKDVLESLLPDIETTDENEKKKYFPHQLDEYTVDFSDGMIFCGNGNPLRLLKTEEGIPLRALLHHLPIRGNTADVVVVMKHKWRKTFRLLMFQVKNSSVGIIGHLRSLDIRRWYENAKNNPMDPFDCQLFSDGEPVRVLCSARPFNVEVLNWMLYFSEVLCREHPILAVNIDKKRLGIDVRTDDNTGEMKLPEDHRVWWPKAAHAHVPHLPPVAPCETIYNHRTGRRFRCNSIPNAIKAMAGSEDKTSFSWETPISGKDFQVTDIDIHKKYAYFQVRFAELSKDIIDTKYVITTGTTIYAVGDSEKWEQNPTYAYPESREKIVQAVSEEGFPAETELWTIYAKTISTQSVSSVSGILTDERRKLSGSKRGRDTS